MALIDIEAVAELAGLSIKNVRAWPRKYSGFPYPKQKKAGTGDRQKYLYDSDGVSAFLKNRIPEPAGMSRSGFDLILAVRFISSPVFWLWKQ